ncbi:MAG: cysteine hydrolase [Acetobacteraceae bacterium]
MNGVSLPQSVIDRVVAKRGTPHIFDRLDPVRTALVVVDMQNAYMDPAAGYTSCAAAVAIVPAVNRLAASVRQAGGGVFWIMNTHDDSCMTEWSVLQDMAAPATRQSRINALVEGSFGQQFWPEMDVQSQDEVVRKFRYSAFYPGTSDLPARLRARGFDTVLITGTLTNVCCESSARDAMMSNFRVVMVSDGNAALTQAEHDASLTALYLSFTDLMDTDMIIARLANPLVQAA